MRSLYLPCLAAAVLLISFTDTHTDETPIILGLVLAASGVLGLLFPGRFIWTWLTTGGTVFVSETLVGYGVLRAPWPPVDGMPWATLVALVPALMGTAAGVGIRRCVSGGLPVVR